MPKRIKTPETKEDADFYAVSQPYPANFEYDREEDRRSFARWVASCLGSTAPVWAIYYKPSAPAKIILEVEKRKDDAHKYAILGEHRWGEILLSPSHDEAKRVSQVFICIHSHGRDVQKDGWLRIAVEDAWFKGWTRETQNIFLTNPYPDTHWCQPPHEDKTNRALCRPLPAKIKPAPPAEPKIVPGSGSWAQAKAAPDPRSPAALRGAWAAGRGRGAVIVESSAWNKPILQNNTGGNRVNQAPVASAWGTKTNVSVSTPSRPPGLPAAPPRMIRSTESSTSSSSASSADPDYGPLANGMFAVSLSESQEKNLYALGDDEDEDAPGFGAADWSNVVVTNVQDSPPVNLWAEPAIVEPVEKPLLCTVHNRVCKKGVCATYDKLFKQREREDARLGIKRPVTGPYNIKVAEAEERERREAERRAQLGGNNRGDDDDGFIAARGKKGRGGRGRGGGKGAGSRQDSGRWGASDGGYSSGRTSMNPSPAPPAKVDVEEEDPW